MRRRQSRVNAGGRPWRRRGPRRGPSSVLERLVVAVVEVDDADAVLASPRRRGCGSRPVQEVPVVGASDHGAGVVLDRLLEAAGVGSRSLVGSSMMVRLAGPEHLREHHAALTAGARRPGYGPTSEVEAGEVGAAVDADVPKDACSLPSVMFSKTETRRPARSGSGREAHRTVEPISTPPPSRLVPDDDLHQGGLAHAVGADDAELGLGRDREGEVAEESALPVALGQVVDVEDLVPEPRAGRDAQLHGQGHLVGAGLGGQLLVALEARFDCLVRAAGCG